MQRTIGIRVFQQMLSEEKHHDTTATGVVQRHAPRVSSNLHALGDFHLDESRRMMGSAYALTSTDDPSRAHPYLTAARESVNMAEHTCGAGLSEAQNHPQTSSEGDLAVAEGGVEVSVEQWAQSAVPAEGASSGTEEEPRRLGRGSESHDVRVGGLNTTCRARYSLLR